MLFTPLGRKQPFAPPHTHTEIPLSVASPTSDIPPPSDRRLQRRFVQTLTRAAVVADVCDNATARIVRAHSRDASAAVALLAGSSRWWRTKRRTRANDYDDVLAVGDHLGVFARRQRWEARPGHERGRRRRHPGVRWGRGIFPDCRPVGFASNSSGVLVTPAMLRQAVEIAVAVLQAEEHTVVLAARLYVAQQRGRLPEAVEMNTKGSVERLRGAVLGLDEVRTVRSSPARTTCKRTCTRARARGRRSICAPATPSIHSDLLPSRVFVRRRTPRAWTRGRTDRLRSSSCTERATSTASGSAAPCR